ncbi:MAG: hypothetical protein KME38_28020 [Spirirestis rafaelensis WJT71-NPBG6]|nr:hypothetical protein [Spirirestis rafaelensis WJT71-NPBG6]
MRNIIFKQSSILCKSYGKFTDAERRSPQHLLVATPNATAMRSPIILKIKLRPKIKHLTSMRILW